MEIDITPRCKFEWEARAKSFKWPARISHRIRKNRPFIKSRSSDSCHRSKPGFPTGYVFSFFLQKLVCFSLSLRNLNSKSIDNYG